MSLNNTMEMKVLNRIFGQDTSMIRPTGSFLALSRAMPLNDLSYMDEPIGQYNYQRQPIVISGISEWSVPQWDEYSYSVCNLYPIVFPEVTGADMGKITHFILFDHPTSGLEENAIMWGDISPAVNVYRGDTITFASGALVMRLS